MNKIISNTYDAFLKLLGITLFLNAIYLVALYLFNDYTEVFGEINVRVLIASLCLGFVSTFIWIKFEDRLPSIKIHYSIQALVRYFLAFIFFMYSFAKFYGTQLWTPYYAWLDTPLGDLTGFELTWSFFGTSHEYTLFIGLSQFACALLLMFRKTQLLGACLLFPIITNIVIVNFEYDIPVKYPSVFFLIMTGYLILVELPRLKIFFWDNALTEPRREPEFSGKQRKLLSGVSVFLLVLFIGYQIFYFEFMTSKYPLTDRPIAGIWKVEEYKINGLDQPVGNDDNWTTLIFEEQFGGTRAIIKTSRSEYLAQYNIDTLNKSLSFNFRKQEFIGHYNIRNEFSMDIKGQLGKDTLDLSLKKKVY